MFYSFVCEFYTGNLYISGFTCSELINIWIMLVVSRLLNIYYFQVYENNQTLRYNPTALMRKQNIIRKCKTIGNWKTAALRFIREHWKNREPNSERYNRTRMILRMRKSLWIVYTFARNIFWRISNSHYFRHNFGRISKF